MEVQRKTIPSEVRNCVLIFGTMVIVQSAHMLEHVVQVIQKFLLRSSFPHGIIGQLDLELVHFIYDLSFLFFLSLLASYYSPQLRVRGKLPYGIFLVALAVQTYHMFEHVVKFSQHMEWGAEGTPGILGYYVNVMWLHFGFNAVVTLAIIIPFIMLGMHRAFTRILVPSSAKMR